MLQDDIFRLSDLSLADSRGTGIAQSPGVFSNAQPFDFFSRKKPERPHRMNLVHQGSSPKLMTPKSDFPDDESTGMTHTSKKRRPNSLKHFFLPSKYRGSQKSLLDSVHRHRAASRRTLASENGEVIS